VCAVILMSQDRYVSHLTDAVAIKSVSGLPEFRNDLFDMVDYTFNVSVMFMQIDG
jgi:hypothetical protein